MFDYVKTSELEAERERRIRAEAEADSLRTNIADLHERLRQALALNEHQGERHQQAQSLLLKHVAPLAPDYSSLSGETIPKVPMTLEEAMLMPAIGHNQIQAKRHFIAELMKERAQAGQTQGVAANDDELTEAEQKRVAEAL